MIDFLIFTGLTMLSFTVGIFGFCQIVGSIKHHHLFPTLSVVVTVVIWSLILFGYASIYIFGFDKYVNHLYFAYGLSFILSFTTKQD